MLAIRSVGVKKEFGTPPTEVLKGIDVEIQRGEFVALTGRSGSGKSTLLYILSSLDNPSSGDVELCGQSIPLMDVETLSEFRNKKIGFVFQFHFLIPELTAIENVLLPATKAGLYDERYEHAVELLGKFNLQEKLDRLPSQLSGGERQRVAIARSLVMQPEIVFADEPTGNLDSINGNAVMEIFKSINKELGTTIVMVTHDKDFAAQGSRQIALSDGLVISDTRV